MELKIDLTREYGIVLEGGGAKGAYQIGAWKALREAGIKIKGIAGASVGSLNGAMICMDDLEKAEAVWSDIDYSKVMDVDGETMKALKKKNFKALNLQQALNSGLKVIKDGGFDITPLKNLIADSVDGEKIRNSGKELFVMTYSMSDRKELAVDITCLPDGEIHDMLLASAYFLAFKNEKLGGKRYMDGGGFNNVPLNVLLEKGYRDIIVIRIYGWGFDSERVTKIPEDANVCHIAPRQDLGGILEFDKKQTRRNMILGYYDGLRLLYGLEGRAYYIDAPNSEPYYFDKMMSELEMVMSSLEGMTDTAGCERLEGYRAFTENLFPQMAQKLKLKEGWNYKTLYLAILEDMARKMRLRRFHVYTADELAQKAYVKLRSLDRAISL